MSEENQALRKAIEEIYEHYRESRWGFIGEKCREILFPEQKHTDRAWSADDEVNKLRADVKRFKEGADYLNLFYGAGDPDLVEALVNGDWAEKSVTKDPEK